MKGKENGYLEKYDVNNLKFENQILIEFIIVIYIYIYIYMHIYLLTTPNVFLLS